MNASVTPASNNISEVVENLRRLSQVEVQSGWRYCDCDAVAAGSVGICNGPVAELNGKGHIAWPSGKQVVYLGQKFVIPNNLHGYPVAGLRLLLGLTWWAEDAQIFVGGELVGQGDLFDCADRVLLSASVNPGDEFLVVLRLVSPVHDSGALVRSICLYEAADSACFDPGFVADELEILQKSLAGNLENKNFQYLPTKNIANHPLFVKGNLLKSEIDLAVNLIDWSALPNRAKFDRSLSVLRHNLLGYLQAFSGELDDLTAEATENAEGRIDRVFEVGENGERISFSGELDDVTAEATENTEGRIDRVFEVGENQYSTSIYIGENLNIKSFSGELDDLTAEATENTEGGGRSRLSLVAEADKITSIYTSKIYLVGHAHLDLAWLWPVPETWEAAERTFESVLKLQSKFPDLIFCHSTPALYAWLEEHRPDLFAAIQKQVAVGRWEVVGGMWVEPDLNLISAESMVRQVVYGQRYAKEKFGELMRVAWLPDTFGFGWQLPQILRQGGVDYFVTQKLRWNDSTQFPYGAFWWEGLDGTKIFSMMSAPIGESIESVKMASYAFDWQVKTNLPDALWLPGVGDHGGGPTRDMLEVAKRWKLSPFFPRLEFAKAVDYLALIESRFLPEVAATLPENDVPESDNQENLQVGETVGNLRALEFANLSRISDANPSSSQLENLGSLPIWKDELYLEFHRGCYTTRADQKRQNRRCEELLYQAELLSSLATICTGAVYPKSELESAWKQVLFNQFHDILPGSAIARVYAGANLAFAEADRASRQILLQSLDAIAAQISLPSPPQPDAQPILIFNTLNWSRSEVVSLPLPDSAGLAWQIYDLSGQRLVSQVVKADRPPSQFTMLFCAEDVPAIGYRVFWLCREDSQTAGNAGASPATENKTDLSKLTYGIAQKNALCQETHFPALETVLENELIRARIDEKTGSLSSIWDKVNRREVLNAAGGNQLQAFQDSGQYWDAWNIDPNYQKHQLPAPVLKEISWVDRGEVRQSLRVVLQIGKSEFCQDYTLEKGSPLLKIKTVADWQETHVLVKAAFGLNVEADFVTCEIPGGAIDRTTKPQTPAEKAKWEVPILRWTDISNDGFGVSLLNDCKYGCDIQPNQIRLTLLRGSTWPDEQADRGVSEFTCAVYPHAGNWQDAGTVRRGCELNLPLLVKVFPQLGENRNKSLPAVGKFLDLSAQNLALMAFKQSEDDANVWILRCCESEGKEAVLELDSDLKLEIVESVDLLERPANLSEKLSQGRGFKIEPWKIASFTVVTNREDAKDAKEEGEGKR
ncbi:alpha-mannosidase [Tychonema sp. LEGE 07199]|uniref:alpha-mannosidase n=1 Tax=unclassified Tychonema TaxID=2642144 RepID=UPI001882412E|nr:MULTISPECIES: alpha-mannosidase [unclassified Tychonema]MBE9121243.1 alpha-mannosidase [Tychonema sp. LEGE 07199]MBE9131681.1 alpha-mannosidase [Tychonema sp. LEGE 07196]